MSVNTKGPTFSLNKNGGKVKEVAGEYKIYGSALVDAVIEDCSFSYLHGIAKGLAEARDQRDLNGRKLQYYRKQLLDSGKYDVILKK